MAKGKATAARGGRAYGRESVALHREGWYGSMRPAVNVKVRGWFDDVDYDALRRDNGEEVVPAWFNWEWIEANVTESEQQEAWDQALSDGWEQMQRDADSAFGGVTGCRRRVQNRKDRGSPEYEPGVRVWSEGRSGGWAIVEGLPEFEPEGGPGGWDAVMLARWRRFERWARLGAAGVPAEAALILAVWVVDERRREALEEYTG